MPSHCGGYVQQIDMHMAQTTVHEAPLSLQVLYEAHRSYFNSTNRVCLQEWTSCEGAAVSSGT